MRIKCFVENEMSFLLQIDKYLDIINIQYLKPLLNYFIQIVKINPLYARCI